MPDFSIIIVTWNALHHLKTYLPSVWEHSHKRAEIIIADNASDDGTALWVAETFPDARMVSLDRNYGYCGGNNRAAAHAMTDRLIFLNNDVEVTPGWLDPLAAVLDEDSGVAAVQPKLRSWTDRDYFEYAGAAGGMLDRYAYPFCRGRIFDTLERDTGQYDDACDISWASGAALAVRRTMFEECGGFDETFEFHMEEIDLCWQLWNRGYRVRYCPGSVVYHLGGGSLPTDSPRKLYYNFRNNLKMIWKNCRTRDLLPRLFIRMLLDGVAFLRSLAGGRLRECGAIFRAHMHFYRSLPGLISTRKKLVDARSVPDDKPVLHPYSIIWQYFLRGRRTFRSLPGTGN
jgi:GT2 family glycosyltransferase